VRVYLCIIKFTKQARRGKTRLKMARFIIDPSISLTKNQKNNIEKRVVKELGGAVTGVRDIKIEEDPEGNRVYPIYYSGLGIWEYSNLNFKNGRVVKN
jgi:hypothetical protein